MEQSCCSSMRSNSYIYSAMQPSFSAQHEHHSVTMINQDPLHSVVQILQKKKECGSVLWVRRMLSGQNQDTLQKVLKYISRRYKSTTPTFSLNVYSALIPNSFHHFQHLQQPLKEREAGEDEQEHWGQKGRIKIVRTKVCIRLNSSSSSNKRQEIFSFF